MRFSIDRNVSPLPASSTLVEVLQTNAALLGDKQAFSFHRDHGGDEITITYRALHQRAMAIGAELQSRIPRGECALLLFPPGLDFIEAFFGCLYAGAVAVPMALPARSRSTSAIQAIVRALDHAIVLSTADHCQLARQSYDHVPTLLERHWIATDTIPGERYRAWRDPNVQGSHTAFLQYTSGSTSSPKGVVLSHDNLLHNAALIHHAFGNTPDGNGVFWLPLYHDMGLIGGVLQPVYCGGSCTLMSPAAFLQRPALWLETISRTHATVSGGPDFAYDLCVRKIRPEQRDGLDLSHWKIAFTGAERVRAQTLQRFAEAFACCGFRRESLFPCYGLAEATLMVSGGPRQTVPTIVRVRVDALQRHQVQDASPHDSDSRTLVGCGRCLPGQRIVIVDPRSHQICPDVEVGEIWVQGRSVAGEYYASPEATRATFGARLATGEGPFLRTGDLGFLRDGQLFVTGRLKDVIIIRGRNFYPEDIEQSVDRAHAAFRAGHCAAFAIDVDDRERLIVVQEIEPRQRDLDADAALRAIRRAIAAGHELEVYETVIVKAGEIPKTSSGKTQRSACRELYLAGELRVVARWKADKDAADDEPLVAQYGVTDQRSMASEKIEDWLIQRISARLKLLPAQVRVTTPFLEFGIGSLEAVEIAAELQQWLGRRISPTAIYNHPNIGALARWLANPQSENEPPVQPYQAHSLPSDDHRPDQLLDSVRNMTEADIEAFLQQEMAKQQASKLD